MPLSTTPPSFNTDADPVDVSILVVSYNTRDMTAAALSSIVAETHATRYEIIAVDNASHDGSADMLKSHPAKPRVLALDENIGFARANNLAAKSARGRYILLLNPDTVILDTAIDEVMAFAARNPAAKIWGGRTVYADGRLNPYSCWRRMTAWNLFCRATGLAAIFPDSPRFNTEPYGGWRRDSVRHVDIVCGCFLLMERSLWNALDGFDPLFFMYGEEADLCLRAKRLGARPMLTPDATLIHYGGASEKTRADKMIRLLNAKTSLIDRHWSPLLRPLGRALNAAWPLSRAVATTLAARLTGNRSIEATSLAWREIWRRRREWMNGYAPATQSPATGTAQPLVASNNGTV